MREKRQFFGRDRVYVDGIFIEEIVVLQIQIERFVIGDIHIVRGSFPAGEFIFVAVAYIQHAKIGAFVLRAQFFEHLQRKVKLIAR